MTQMMVDPSVQRMVEMKVAVTVWKMAWYMMVDPSVQRMVEMKVAVMVWKMAW